MEKKKKRPKYTQILNNISKLALHILHILKKMNVIISNSELEKMEYRKRSDLLF